MVEAGRDDSGVGDDPGEVTITCADEASARAEAQRRQELDGHDAEWTYFRRGGEWVAKRFPRDEANAEKRASWKERAADVVFEMLNPLNWF